jgi:glyoxylase-like metal-dependent hydrolase (beta-lactamase superfamily II)
MFLDLLEIIQTGEENGSNTIFRLTLPSGREVVGLATENKYGGEWDLGPTWNYVVGPERPFLVDTGKSGMGYRLLEMMGKAGIQGQDLEFVLLSHGHEDHDGGLAELVYRTGTAIKAHPIYDRLCRIYPQHSPAAAKETFSASCWNCMLPESFTQVHCRKYHKERNGFKVESLNASLNPGVQVHHLPGHSPDSVAVQIGDEALIVGDIILPEITPHPSQEKTFQMVQPLLPPRYSRGNEIYGLGAYLDSLKKLGTIAVQFPNLVVLPGHRLFNAGQWNALDLKTRVDEGIEHHIQRCGAILTILKEGAQTAEEVARRHFDPKLLKGPGIKMAIGEILSHAEFLLHTQDIQWVHDQRLESLGSSHFESRIKGEMQNCI